MAGKKYKELLDEDAPVGYRFWKLSLKDKGKPRLVSLGGIPWEPVEVEATEPISGEKIKLKELKSDYDPRAEPDFATSSHGFYSKLSPKELIDDYGHEKRESVAGAILPYGKTKLGDRGFRSEKARVSAIFKGTIPCFICAKKATVFLEEKSEDRRTPLCETCRKRVDKFVAKLGDRVEEYNIDEILQQLADYYGAELVEPPEGF